MQLTAFAHAILTQATPAAMPAAAASLIAAFRACSQPAAIVAVTAVWQGAAIASALAICLRLAPRTSAEHRFAVWTAAFVTLVSLPFLALISALPTAALAGVSSASSQAATRPLLNIDIRWSLLIAALWAAATLLRAADLAVHSFRLRKLWKQAIPVSVDCSLSSMLASTWNRAHVEVCTTTVLQRPSVIGFFKPRILIPDWLFARLTPGELEQIVLHEAQHLRRRDDWTNLFQKLCLVLFPLNPALVWIERRLCREREMACDDGVIQVTHAPRAYAACLASLAERGLQRRAEALSLGAWQRRPELVHRVHSILRRKHTLGPLATRALLATLGCGLLAGSIELARCPQLIAFVPAPNLEASTSLAQPFTAADSKLQVPNIAATASESQGKGTASQHVSPRQSKPVAAIASTGRTALQQNAALEFETSAIESTNHSPRPVLLKAEIPVKQSAPAQEEQWIVLTTWEQVQISNRNPGRNTGLIADYETGANQAATSKNATSKNATGNQKVQPTPQPAGQVFVTRLILRIFPASSLSTQPASVPLRSGWFVIQL